MMTSLTREMGWYADFVAGQVFVDGPWHGHAWTEGQDELGPFLLEPTVGPARVFRYRPNAYHREMILAPERCPLLN